MLLPLLLGAASLALALPQPEQVVLAPPTSPSSPAALDNASWTTYSHADHPKHKLRLRHPQGLCDPGVKQVSGYVDTARGHHAFFWAFESRNDPETDPVVLWLNGGPGCSSFIGLLQELGPCKIQPNGEPGYNPYSWNNNATVIFLDQPTGVGFSYGEKDAPKVWTTEAAAEDLFAFLHIFFATFADKFGKSALHIAGESYAGRYIPVFADYIVKQNEKAERNGYKQLNLTSVLIGNGFTHPLIQYHSYLPFMCSANAAVPASSAPLVDAAGCAKLEGAWPVCERLLTGCYNNPSDSALCLSAYRFCEERLTAPYEATGRNSYDWQRYGEYEEGEWAEAWLNREEVRRELGVDFEDKKHPQSKRRKFISCSDKVFQRFEDSADGVKPSYKELATVLDKGVDVLIYVGMRDMICNVLGNEAWTLDPSFTSLWTNGTRFAREELRPWFAEPSFDRKEGRMANAGREKAGEYRQYGRMAFAGVEGAGHFVPYDKPREALALFNRWMWQRKIGYE
ncbi:hypothetical protein JCM10213_002208 [Rhodosporidiobolus nylandii]